MLLDRLMATTESLCDAARVFATDHAADLLARRGELAASLQSALRQGALTADQRHKLEQVIRLGEQASQALLIKRETSRSELQEKLAGRHLNESFKPYRPKKLGTLNIKL